jgi:hypothetical protein
VGVIDDVGEVVGMQPHIQGMEYGSGRRDAEVGFQMLLTIREQGCDAISPGDACALQRGCEPARAPVQIAHGGSAARTVWLDGDDLYAGEDSTGALQDAGNQERAGHHGGLHGTPVNGEPTNRVHPASDGRCRCAKSTEDWGGPEYKR